MGIMICDVHGRTGFVETCSHAARQIDEGQFPDGRHVNLSVGLFVCDNCYGSLGFDRFARLASLPLEQIIQADDAWWEAFEAAYNQIEGRRSYCLKCFEELECR